MPPVNSQCGRDNFAASPHSTGNRKKYTAEGRCCIKIERKRIRSYLDDFAPGLGGHPIALGYSQVRHAVERPTPTFASKPRAAGASRLHALVRPPGYPCLCRLLNRPAGYAAGCLLLPITQANTQLGCPHPDVERGHPSLPIQATRAYHLFSSFSLSLRWPND